MKILIFFLLLLSNVNAQLCTCAVDSLNSNISRWTLPWGSEPTPKCDLRMSMDCRHSIMWTYYLQNNYPNNISILISINRIDNCTEDRCISNSFFFFANRTIKIIDLGKTLINTGDWYISNTFLGSVSRYTLYGNPYLYINHKNVSLKIYDNKGMFPQGKYGYVRSGKHKCSTAYSCSMLSTKFDNGFGYGEYVHGSIDKSEKLPYWVCFYLHLQNYDISICGDPVNKEYARMHILMSNGTYFDYQDKSIYDGLVRNTYWKSNISEQIYYIDWSINIIPLHIKIHAVPTIKNSEFCIQKNCFWIGTTNLYINNNKVGLGITEVFNFTKPTTKKELFYSFFR